MILKFLDKIGRKKVALDRGLSHPKYSEAKPWMNRYYLLLDTDQNGFHLIY